MIIAVVVLSIIVLIALLLWGVDFVHFVSARLARFHIGRWTDETEWQAAVTDRAAAWTKKTPTVKITDNSRYVLLDVLNGTYRSAAIQSWQNAALILGLKGRASDAALKSALGYLNTDGSWKAVPSTVDSAMLAYAILCTVPDPASVRPAMDQMAEVIVRNTDNDGLISYCGGTDNNERYVDAIGLVCPFLARYARVYELPEYRELALKQIRFYHDHGLLPGTELPCHAISKDRRLPLGVYGWGRGTVWYTLGLFDTWKELPAGDDKDQLAAWIRESADSYRRYQREDGGFGGILQRSRTYDSSATAGLAWFYRVCGIEFQSPDYAATADLCLKKLRSVTRRNGAIDWCQGDTKDIGVFAQTYDVMPFAQGMAIRAFKPEE